MDVGNYKCSMNIREVHIWAESSPSPWKPSLPPSRRKQQLFNSTQPENANQAEVETQDPFQIVKGMKSEVKEWD